MKIRIVAKSPGHNQRARGQDTRVLLVLDDGTELPLPDVVSAKWSVGGRAEYCTATLVLHGVDVDVDGTLGSYTSGFVPFTDEEAAALETLVRLRSSK